MYVLVELVVLNVNVIPKPEYVAVPLTDDVRPEEFVSLDVTMLVVSYGGVFDGKVTETGPVVVDVGSTE